MAWGSTGAREPGRYPRAAAEHKFRCRRKSTIPRAPISPEPISVLPILETHHEESHRGESHPPVLAEPGVNVSAHRAPIVRPSGRTPKRQCANRPG
jgi:hypothetical protein